MANGGSFSVLQGEVDGRPMIAMIDMGLRGYKEKSTVPWFLSLSTPLVNPTADGLPTKGDSKNLDEWEDAVEKELIGEGRFTFVGRVTRNGHRELLYYIHQPATSTKKLQRLIDAHLTRPFAFRYERDDKWEKANYWLSQPNPIK